MDGAISITWCDRPKMHRLVLEDSTSHSVGSTSLGFVIVSDKLKYHKKFNCKWLF